MTHLVAIMSDGEGGSIPVLGAQGRVKRDANLGYNNTVPNRGGGGIDRATHAGVWEGAFQGTLHVYTSKVPKQVPLGLCIAAAKRAYSQVPILRVSLCHGQHFIRRHKYNASEIPAVEQSMRDIQGDRRGSYL
ncbi:hypothetical protein CHU98_g11156 [Xylaria longipes]|nr:hypothetical protein CHU98_g11156 [Xylaria longipes]